MTWSNVSYCRYESLGVVLPNATVGWLQRNYAFRFVGFNKFSIFKRLVMRNFTSLHIFLVCLFISSLVVVGCDRRPKEYAGIKDSGDNAAIDPHSY